MALTGRSGIGTLTDRIQSIACDLYEADPIEIFDVVRDYVRELPKPENALEQMTLAVLLARVVVAIIDRLHGGHMPNQCACYNVSTDLVRDLLRRSPHDVRSVFYEWMKQAEGAFIAIHPPALATKAIFLIRRQPSQVWTVTRLAAALCVPRRQLAQSFKTVYASSIGNYIHLARLELALPEIIERGAKIEAVALQVGYRSKKDFYRACRKLLRTTPAALRALADDDKVRLYATIRRQLVSRVVVGQHAGEQR